MALNKFIKEQNIFKGTGYPYGHINSRTPSGGEITGHSTIIDNFLSFGIILFFNIHYYQFFFTQKN